jgi:hypothetical protein
MQQLVFVVNNEYMLGHVLSAQHPIRQLALLIARKQAEKGTGIDAASC